MKIYVAGKITGMERAETVAKFEEARAALVVQGHSVFVPTVLPECDDVPHEDYLHICFAMIDICDAIYMLSDWRQSRGSRMELEYAKDHEKRILFEDGAAGESE